MNARQILRSPEGIEGGGGEAPREEEEEVVTISRAELEALREGARRRGEEDRGERNGELVEEERRRGAEREAALRKAIRERELAVALAGRPLVAGAASQLLKLWGEELDVYEEEGRYRVATRDGRSVMEAVTGWLSSREYAHFCAPTSKGGTAVPGQPKVAMGQGGESRTLGEAVLQRWREGASARGNGGGEPVGLGRRR